VIDRWNCHLKQFYGQLELGFEIVIVSQAASSKWYPGLAFDVKGLHAGKVGIQDLPTDTQMFP
jgi:hypothetical protein